jgi:hypothetical protein
MLAAVAGLGALVAVAGRPAWFWPIVIFANMVGNGPRINTYLLLDEIVTAGAVVGALFHIAASGAGAEGAPRTWHTTAFAIWIGYMVMQSIVGIAVTGDARIVRWVVFYALLGALAVVGGWRRAFPFPAPRRAWQIIVAGIFVASAGFLAQGLYFEHTLDLRTWGRFDSQDYFWSGGAYAAFPLVIGVPATLILLRDRSRGVRWFCWATLLLLMATGLYFLSRITWMVLLGFLAFNLRRMGLRRAAFGAAAFLALFVALGSGVEDIGPFFAELLETTQALSTPGESDVTRNLQVRGALETVGEDWVTGVTGSGIYTHRLRIAPHMRRLHDQYVSEAWVGSLLGQGATPIEVTIETVYRTTGFGALLIDSGVIGMALFALNIGFAGIQLVRGRSPHRGLLILSLPMVVLWLFVANTTDIVLQYLMLMPHGLLARLGEAGTAGVPANERLGTEVPVPA